MALKTHHQNNSSVEKMCSHTTRLLLFLVTISWVAAARPLEPLEASAPESSYYRGKDFIRESCNSTLYPDVCYQALAPYNATIQDSPLTMALTALNVSLEATKRASTAVRKIIKANKLRKREAGAVADCVETVEDAVDELKQSMVAMQDLEGPEFQFKVSNIQTWVSAALTDDTTCMDGIEEKGSTTTTSPTTNNEKMKRLLRSEILNVAQLTSVALALVNKLRSAY